MSDVNLLMLSGRVAADLELKRNQSGTAWLRFPFATNKQYKQEQKTEWTNVTVFGKTAEAIAEHCRKGTRLLLIGSKETSEYTDKQGNKQYSTAMILQSFNFLDPKTEPAQPKPAVSETRNAYGYPGDFDDDLPF